MSPSETEFLRLYEARELDAAALALERWVAVDPPGDAVRSYWSAAVLQKKGQFDAAIEQLSKIISARGDMYQLCLIERADQYFKRKKFDLALLDFQALLDDPTPKVAEALHPTAQFHKLYILAVLGDPGFEAEFATINPDYQQWMNGGFVTRADLERTYKRAVAQPKLSSGV
jgi:tetratricopeptide (TPR) repeat protein